MSSLPTAIGRLRRRRDEGEEEWAARYAVAKRKRDEAEHAKAVEKARRIEERRKAARTRHKKSTGKAPYETRSPRALALLETAFAVDPVLFPFLGDDDPPVARDWSLFPRPRALDRSERARYDTLAPDGLLTLRWQQAKWVAETYEQKQAEALCDLDCMFCPRARTLHCAASNRTAAAEDGFTITLETGAET